MPPAIKAFGWAAVFVLVAARYNAMQYQQTGDPYFKQQELRFEWWHVFLGLMGYALGLVCHNNV